METALVNYMQEQLQAVTLDFKRYMYSRLPWEARLVGLMGPRCIGKSTIILQFIKSQSEERRAKSFYVSADHSYFSSVSLIEVADRWVRGAR